jgi:hypothetical protein
MSWMRLESSFRSHPKLVRLARELSVDVVLARGLMTGLWSWCLEYFPDGHLLGCSDEDIADAAGWHQNVSETRPAMSGTVSDAIGTVSDAFGRGSRHGARTVGQREFVEILVRLELIDRADDGPVIHDWMDYAEGFRNAKRKQELRLDRKSSRSISATETVRDTAGTVRDTAGDVYLTGRDGTGRRGEEDFSSSCAELALAEQAVGLRLVTSEPPEHRPTSDSPLAAPATESRLTGKAASVAPAAVEISTSATNESVEISNNARTKTRKPKRKPPKPADASPVLATFAVRDGEWHLRASLAGELRAAFPSVDFEREVREARAWCVTEEAKRKTSAGMPRFLRSWLSRAQSDPKRHNISPSVGLRFV